MDITVGKFISINKDELSENILDLLRDIFGDSFDDNGGFISKTAWESFLESDSDTELNRFIKQVDELAFENGAEIIIFE